MKKERSFDFTHKETLMRTWKPAALALAVAALVAACGGGDVDDGSSFDLTGAPGSLLAAP